MPSELQHGGSDRARLAESAPPGPRVQVPSEAQTPALRCCLRSRTLGGGKGCRGEAGLHWWNLPGKSKDWEHGDLFPTQSKGKLRLELGHNSYQHSTK